MADLSAADKRFNRIIEQDVGDIDHEMLLHIDQKGLRDGLCMLRTAAALVEKYLDIRNEQGRGGE